MPTHLAARDPSGPNNKKGRYLAAIIICEPEGMEFQPIITGFAEDQ
jgi:hypothetical protein